MKFQILHESPGRVRLRTVRPFMSMEQADLLEAYLTALPGVEHVTVHERVGGVKRKMGNPDLVIFFTGAMSHKMLQGALGEIKGQDVIEEYCPTSSVSALKKVLEKYA